LNLFSKSEMISNLQSAFTFKANNSALLKNYIYVVVS